MIVATPVKSRLGTFWCIPKPSDNSKFLLHREDGPAWEGLEGSVGYYWYNHYFENILSDLVWALKVKKLKELYPNGEL
jgi:hypothetical protein